LKSLGFLLPVVACSLLPSPQKGAIFGATRKALAPLRWRPIQHVNYTLKPVTIGIVLPLKAANVRRRVCECLEDLPG